MRILVYGAAAGIIMAVTQFRAGHVGLGGCLANVADADNIYVMKTGKLWKAAPMRGCCLWADIMPRFGMSSRRWNTTERRPMYEKKKRF